MRSPHRGSGLPVNDVVPLSPRVMPSPVTVTVTGEALGFKTRMATGAVSPGFNDTGSGGTETAIERGPPGPELGDGPRSDSKWNDQHARADRYEARQPPPRTLAARTLPRRQLNCSSGLRCT